jgi:hypothetical protein
VDNLCCAVLCCAVLCCAVLCCAVLCCAVLCCAALCCAVLCCAALCCAVLCSWWYPKDAGGAVITWEAEASIFPDGLDYVYNQTGWPIQVVFRGCGGGVCGWGCGLQLVCTWCF